MKPPSPWTGSSTAQATEAGSTSARGVAPALCATLLKAPADGELKHHGGFFGWFNRNFERMNHGYTRSVEHVTQRTGRYLLLYGVVVLIMGALFVTIPKSFLPDEDQGVLFAQVVAPPGTPDGDHRRDPSQVRDHFLKDEKDAVQSVFTVNGFSFGGRGQGSGLAFVSLKGWGARTGEGTTAWPRSPRAPTSTSHHPRRASLWPLRRPPLWSSAMPPALISSSRISQSSVTTH